MTVQAIMALGSSIPPREATLRAAVEAIHQLDRTRIVSISRLYETDPVGGPPQGLFLNAAALAETSLAPEALLDALLEIEKKLGRQRSIPNAPRTIDLDIIFYSDRTVERPGLSIPHPRFRERGFVLQPLVDIIPGFIDPLSKEKVPDLLDRWIRAGGKPVEGREFRGFCFSD